jgi:L-threonylcarbamoyladenylate synthase
MRRESPGNDRGFDPSVGHLLPPMPGEDRDGRVVVLPAAAPNAIEWTAERIAAGGVVAIPTDTVYGIAASLAHESALSRIFTVKARPEDRTLPVLIASTDALARVAADISDETLLLLDRYWPGPLSVVVAARAGMPSLVTGPGETIGVRLPNHPLAIEVIAKAGGAIACTSANRSSEAPARTADEVAETIGDGLDLILDGGRTPGGVASTVLAVEGDTIRVLREGAIPSEHLLATWREVFRGT